MKEPEMGMYDEVWFDEGHPSLASRCQRFQTKSLERCMDRYIVTKEGRLCLAGNTLMADCASPARSEKVDTGFHGDIRLVSDQGNHEVYIARFTHGTLEWIRPAAEITQVVVTR
jgi:hypothetical protein